MNDYASSNATRLLARAREGEAVGELLVLYRRYLKVLARMHIDARLHGKLDASDVVQEVYLQAHRSFPQFRGTTEEELLGWLRRILASVLADFTRKFYGAHRDLRLEERMDAQLDRSSQALGRIAVDARSTPSEQAVRKEQAVLLADAMEQLPEDYREVIMLRHLEDLSFPDVALRMNRSQDSVKNVWARALVQLQQLLSGA